MALSYGLTNPAAMMGSEAEVTPDLFKFYTAVPYDSSQSSASNKRRPQLFTSLNGGSGWNNENTGSTSGWYWVNYGGNLYFNHENGHLEAWAHKSLSSSYGAYKATQDTPHLKNVGWNTSSVVAYSTANQPNSELCRNMNSTSYPGRYFCIREGGGYAYNNTPWSTANWTTTSFGTSYAYTENNGFKHICVNPDDTHAALIYLATNDSKKYHRLCYCDLDNLVSVVDYTATALGGSTTHYNSDYKSLSIDYLPGVGFLIFYSYLNENGFRVRILRTYDETTGEKLAYNQFVADSHDVISVGGSVNKIVAQGSHGWYCPWTKEYYFAPNAAQVFWTRDGINWNSSTTTGLSSSALCYKFITDGTRFVVSSSGNGYNYSMNKGQTWTTGATLPLYGFNQNRSTDAITLPYKCINNIGIDTSQVVLGQFYGSNGNIGTLATNFRLDAYIPVDPSTSYVFYGKNSDGLTHSNRISFYDSNKTFISRIDSNSQVSVGSNTYSPVIAESPSNAAYARICCRISSSSDAVTQELVDSYKWYFAKEDDFKVMTNYGDIVVN